MAYRRTYRRRTTNRRPSTRRGSSRRLVYKGRTRVSRITRRRPVNKKRILTISSRKKRDTMLQLTNVNSERIPTSEYNSDKSQLIGGGQPYLFLWCCTARQQLSNPTLFGTIRDDSTRTSKTCFMRGLKENIEINIENGVPWQWRRILFSMKGTAGYFQNDANAYIYNITNFGYQRTVNEASSNNTSNFNSLVFKGDQGVDWIDPLIAPTDNTRVTILYDKTMTIASGNNDGVIRKYTRWHPFNKNLVYGDDESGGDIADQVFSTVGKPGMGDVFVADIFKPRDGSEASDILDFRTNATLYWHEK